MIDHGHDITGAVRVATTNGAAVGIAPTTASDRHAGAGALAARKSEGHDLRALAATLSADEKVSLLVGATAWTTTAIDRIGLRSIHLSDGPVGVRGAGTTDERTSAMMPAPSALAATWDRGLAARTGELFAAEARRHDVDVVLAPQVNLQRTPVAGRHFECYSEDPHLTAEIAVALVRAAQSRGVAMCAKHFVANDSETDRTSYLVRVDERTLREVYLAPFECLVEAAGVWTVMGAYSGIDHGETAAPMLEHRPLLTGVLKEEWGFDGVVISDWVATKSIAPAVRGGLDLQMPGPDGVWGDGLRDAVRVGEVDEHELDDKVVRLLRLAARTGALGAAPARPTPDEIDAAREDAARFLRELAARSVVVLKDDEALVPLDADRLAAPGRGLHVALLGPAGTSPFLQGGGSSFVVPDRVTTPADALRDALADGTRLVVADGARSSLTPSGIDVAARVTDPVTSGPGIHLELLDARGDVLRSWNDPSWEGWLRDVPADAATLRLRADVRFDEPGEHRFGFGTVGRHVVRIDDSTISSSDEIADVNVILNSEWNHPTITTVPITGPATAHLDADLQVVHPVGYGSFVRGQLAHGLPGRSTEEVLAEAVHAAARADVAIVVVGTTEEVESEGRDRSGLDLPGNQDELVRRVLTVNARTIVIVNAGAPVLLPWFDDAPTVLWGWLGGQEAGAGIADVLTGITEPSGRLPWTLPARADDVPLPNAIPIGGVVAYTEGRDVGYRAWERLDRRPAAPFGHGLGWTSWEYTDARLVTVGDGSNDVRVAVSVTNTGRRDGREVVQIYVEPERADPERPVRWLGGFALVDVAASSSSTVEVRVPARALQVWDVAVGEWRQAIGGHRLRIGRSVRDLRLSVDVADAGVSSLAAGHEWSPISHRYTSTSKETS